MILLSQEEFVPHETPHSQLWIKGWINITVDALQAALEAAQFPYHLRGNFAMIWTDGQGNTCMAVDHYATIPLFYTEQHVGQYFHDVKHTVRDRTRDALTCDMIKLFAGMSVGPGTTYNEIKRIEPGHYLWNGEARCYNDILQLPMQGFDPAGIRDSLVGICREDYGPTALVLSGGKDSTTLCGIIRYENIPCSYISIHSPNQIFKEQHIVDRICAHHGIDRTDVEIANSGMILDDDSNDRFFDFWIDNPFTAKHAAVDRAGLSDHTIMTGEGGCGTYGVRSMLAYAAQRPNITARMLCEYMVLDMASYNKRHARDLNLIPDNLRRAFDYLVDHYERKWHGSNLSDTHKIVHLNTQDMSTYRAYPYSQDRHIRWWHPYLDWRWVDATVPCDPQHKINGKYEKYLYLSCFSEMITSIPWEYPKNGLSIPALSKY